MKYFIDTEFIEGFKKPLFGKRRHFIDLVTIGIHREDGKSLYLLSKEWSFNDADEWVKDNVILPLYKEYVSGDCRNITSVNNFQKLLGFENEQIKNTLLDFFGCWRDQLFWRAPDGIEVYGYYSDYDWVLFCSLFGRMIDLPKGFPMYCKDLKQMLDEKLMTEYAINDTFVTLLNSNLDAKYIVEIRALKTLDEKLGWIKKYCKAYPKQNNEHNALADAKWNYELYKFIQSL